MNLSKKIRALLGTPSLVILVVLFAFAFARIVVTSFTTNSSSAGEGRFSFENYILVFSDRSVLSSILLSIAISLLVTAIGVLVCYPLAITYSQARGTWRFALSLIIFLPLLASQSVTSYGWLVLLGQGGFVNRILMGIGIVNDPVPFMHHISGLVIAHEQWVLPFIILPLAASLGEIDSELYRAARSLGSGTIRAFLRVTLPLSRSGLTTGAVLSFALTMSSYVTPAVIGGGRLQVAAIAIYDQFMVLFNAPFGSAIAVVLFIIVIVPVAIFVKGSIFGSFKSQD